MDSVVKARSFTVMVNNRKDDGDGFGDTRS